MGASSFGERTAWHGMVWHGSWVLRHGEDGAFDPGWLTFFRFVNMVFMHFKTLYFDPIDATENKFRVGGFGSIHVQDSCTI